MRVKFILFILSLFGHPTWPSWSGYGVTTSWPNPKCRKEIARILWLMKYLLPDEYFVSDPTFVNAGALVIYVWRKDDPRAQNQSRQTTPFRGVFRSYML